MPIVDGFTSTKMIRSFEKTHSRAALSPRARLNGKIPIFAVSASLVESDREKYIETGFDGWILKPVDFKRVDLLLRGIVDVNARDQCIYEAGKTNWEKGGWFEKRQERSEVDFHNTDTKPSEKSPTSGTASMSKDAVADAVDEQNRPVAQQEVENETSLATIPTADANIQETATAIASKANTV